MNVLITGGTGLIGRALTHRLTSEGDTVVILSRSAERPDWLPESAKVVKWDGCTGEGWSDELARVDAVVNLAGESIGEGRWTQAKKQRLYDSRINSGKAIVDAASHSGAAPARLIQASGVNYYGHRDEPRITEDEPPGDDFLSNLCVDWELSTEPLDALGTKRVSVRNGIVLDASDGALPLLAMPFRFFVGGRIASGDQGVSWMHIDDHVEALLFLLRNHDLTGGVNLSAPIPVSNRKLTRALSNALNRPALFPVPTFALRIIIGEFANHLIHGQYVVPERLENAGFEFKFRDIDSALEDLFSR